MCWNQQASAAFTLLGLAAAGVVWKRTKNGKMTSAVLFFCVMELLQSVQYFFIADKLGDAECRMRINQILTLVGYLHIQLQPYVTNLYMQAFRPSTGKAGKHEDVAWALVQKLCVLQCALGLSRLVLSPSLWDRTLLTETDEAYYAASRDWLEGSELCTYRGAVHLAWSIPLARPAYFIAGMGLHSFMMFAPVLCIGGFRELDSVSFLMGTGPILSMYLTNNHHEQASIWCFFSTAQCAIGAISAVAQHNASKKPSLRPRRAKAAYQD
jgi:hypothetical protein